MTIIKECTIKVNGKYYDAVLYMDDKPTKNKFVCRNCQYVGDDKESNSFCKAINHESITLDGNKFNCSNFIVGEELNIFLTIEKSLFADAKELKDSQTEEEKQLCSMIL